MRHWATVTGMAGLFLTACAGLHAPDSGGVAGAAASQACIPLAQVAGRRVVNGSAILFEMTGPTNFSNPLLGQCPGLARLGSSATVSIAKGGEGGNLCRGDRIRVADPVEVDGQALSSIPTCVLADFQPVAKVPSR